MSLYHYCRKGKVCTSTDAVEDFSEHSTLDETTNQLGNNVDEAAYEESREDEITISCTDNLPTSSTVCEERSDSTASNNSRGSDNAISRVNGGDFIIHGSIHQGDTRFSPSSRGIQCTAIAATAIALAAVKHPRA